MTSIEHSTVFEIILESASTTSLDSTPEIGADCLCSWSLKYIPGPKINVSNPVITVITVAMPEPLSLKVGFAPFVGDLAIVNCGSGRGARSR